MSSQEFTTLLSTVIGGLLAVIGGFSASYLIQAIHRSEEKRRRIFEKLEEIFELSTMINELTMLNVYYTSRELVIDFADLDYKEGNQLTVREIVEKTKQSYVRIKMLARIYAPRLNGNVVIYHKDLKELRSMIGKAEIADDESARDFNIRTREFADKITEEFQKSIEKEIIRLR